MRRLGFGIALLLGAVGNATAEEESSPSPTVDPPKLLKFVEAIYPPRALSDRVEATVVVELSLSDQGVVESVSLVESSTLAEAPELVASSTITDYGFVRSATTAVSQFDFEPAKLNGKPIPIRIRYTYNFRLPAKKAPPKLAADTSSVAPEPAEDQGPIQLQGLVLQQGIRSRIPGAVVRITGPDDERREELTDEAGAFAFRGLAPGSWQVVVEAQGYYPVLTNEEIRPNEVLEATYYLEQAAGGAYEVVVRGKRPEKEVTRRTLDRADIVKVAGTLGDPILVVENLPGVARPPFGAGAIVVRGSAPQDTGIFIEGIQVPLIYHFGGIKSVLPADMIESVDFYPGNYSVSYGRAMGGILDARVRRIEPDQVHGAADVSLLDAGLYLEAPIGDEAAIAVAGRRSYVDFILKSVISEDSSVGLIAAPRYYDYQVLGKWRPNRRHELRLFFFGSSDKLGLLFDEPADLDAQLQSGSLDASTAFNRIVATYYWKPSSNVTNDLRLAFGRDEIDTSFFDQFRFALDLRLLQLRDALSVRVSERASLSFGLDAFLSVVDVNVRAPRPPREGDVAFNPDLTETLEANIDDEVDTQLGPWVEAEIEIVDDLTLLPGIRLDYFSEGALLSVDPRLVSRYRVDDEWTVKGGVGLVHQPPQPFETSVEFGNPDLGLQRAVHVSAGAEYRPLEYLSFDGTVFYKRLDQLVSSSSRIIERDGEQVPEVYDNGGRGNIYGFELFVRHDFTHNFRGWLSYTLSRSERTESGASESRIFSFDQTHILALVASYVLPENWEVGVRWRFVTGNPYTPFVDGVFLSDFDRYNPIPAAVNSERLPSFHQLDLRLEKRWVYDLWVLAAYVSLTNAYNRSNVEGLSYNYDFSETDEVSGLPIFPIIGLRGEF